MAEEASEKKEQPDAGHIPITEEMDSARWTLPALKPLLAAAGIVAVAVALYLWLGGPQQVTTGAIEKVLAAQVEGQPNTLVAIHLRLSNTGEKPLWIREVRATLKTKGEQYTDKAASAVDHDRYFQVMPELGEGRLPPLVPDQRIERGQQQAGMVVVAFPVSKEDFDNRESLAVTLDAYDRTPLVIRETTAQ